MWPKKWSESSSWQWSYRVLCATRVLNVPPSANKTPSAESIPVLAPWQQSDFAVQNEGCRARWDRSVRDIVDEKTQILCGWWMLNVRQKTPQRKCELSSAPLSDCTLSTTHHVHTERWYASGPSSCVARDSEVGVNYCLTGRQTGIYLITTFFDNLHLYERGVKNWLYLDNRVVSRLLIDLFPLSFEVSSHYS